MTHGCHSGYFRLAPRGCGGYSGSVMRLLLLMCGVMAAAWSLCSCGTQVYLHRWEPSQVDLPRGTVLHLRTEVHGPLRCELRRAFEQQIARDGYYALSGVGAGAKLRLHRVHVEMSEPPEDAKGEVRRPRPSRVSLTADVLARKQRIYRRDCSEFVRCDFEDRPDWEEVAEDIAADVMRDLTPHLVRYSVTVDSVEENPEVELAAQACRAGNWSGGEAYARQALSRNPREAEAYYVLGLIERAACRYEASDAYFRKAYELKPEGKYLSAVSNNVRLQADALRAAVQLSGE